MKKYSDNDNKLASFLQRNKPIAPPPIADLENQIMGAINTLAIENTSMRTSHPFRYLWVGLAAIASGAIGIFSYQWLNQTQPTLAELQSVEQYLTDRWQGLITEPDRRAVIHNKLADLDYNYLLELDLDPEEI